MITLLLVRHAMCDPVGRLLAGRAPGVHLNAEGRAQAERLAERLGGLELDGIYTSPLERALETAEPIARRTGCSVEPLAAFTELEFGAWTGCTLAELDGDPVWRRFNAQRSVARPPGGESMLEVQARAVAGLEALRRRHPDGRALVVSHGDVIRSVVAHLAGIPLDLFQRLEISPASVTVVELGEEQVLVRGVNSV
jgi:probable phosphomutase (TIGR03848 family)